VFGPLQAATAARGVPRVRLRGQKHRLAAAATHPLRVAAVAANAPSMGRHRGPKALRHGELAARVRLRFVAILGHKSAPPCGRGAVTQLLRHAPTAPQRDVDPVVRGVPTALLSFTSEASWPACTACAASSCCARCQTAALVELPRAEKLSQDVLLKCTTLGPFCVRGGVSSQIRSFEQLRACVRALRDKSRISEAPAINIMPLRASYHQKLIAAQRPKNLARVVTHESVARR